MKRGTDASCGNTHILQFHNVSSLHTTRTLLKIESDCLTLIKGFEAFTLDSREVYKHILAVFASDEALILFSIEPLYGTFVH
jgi:hypothetical protein